MDKLRGHWDHSTKPSKFCVKRGNEEIYRGGYSEGYELLMNNIKTPATDDLARGNHVVPTEWAQQLERERDEARGEITKLNNWKDSALSVMEKVQFQEAGKAIGAQIGDDVAGKLLPAIEILKRERDEAGQIGEAYSALAWNLEGERNKLRRENAKLREIAERAMEYTMHDEECKRHECTCGLRELRAELDQFKEGAK